MHWKMYFSGVQNMQTLYSLLILITSALLRIAALFNQKLGLFVSGRKKVFETLKDAISKSDQTIWMHVASLGEYEQGLPLLKKIKSDLPGHKILLTFFSPSGYEVRKHSPYADVITYLPLDTHGNAQRFIRITNPKLAIFIKYEIWPNYLGFLKQSGVPVVLVSAIFSKRQIFFKPWGGLMRNTLKAFTHFFVQDDNSKKLLNGLHFQNVTVIGDTRFDRVAEILDGDTTLDFMEEFTKNEICLVAGSTWPEDETLLVPFINTQKRPLKYVIAPHNIKATHIQKLVDCIDKKVILYSQLNTLDPKEYDVLVVDTIGMLTKIYSYAHIAYVGGGFATGLHNTLEPAVFGIPVVIGPDYHGFKEARELVKAGGIVSIANQNEFNQVVQTFLEDVDFAQKTGAINASFILASKGAADKVMRHIKDISGF